MKKLLILALVAIVAGSAFASTDPAFSGDFEYTTMMDFTNKEYVAEDNNGSAAIALNGTVDEWSTVTAEFSADNDSALELNQFTMTTDVTGALGVDGPVSFSITWGAVTHEAAEYQGVAGYDDADFTTESSSVIGAKLSIGLGDNITLITLIAPSSYLDDAVWTDKGTGIIFAEPIVTAELQFVGMVEGLDFNVFFALDKNKFGMEIGATAGYEVDALAVGLIAMYYEYALGDDFGFGVSAAYTVGDALTLGLAYLTGGVSDFTGTSGVGLNATWMAADVLDVFGAVGIGFDASFKWDAGVIFKLGATSYTVGYAMNGSGFQSPNSTTSGDGLFLKVKGSF